ncbi:hypothetical protein JOM56_012623 [Amanita muscaria]
MLDVLKSELLKVGCTNHFIEDPAFVTLLGTAYKNQQDYGTGCGYQWIRTRGEELTMGQKRYLATIVNQHSMNWTALIIDFEQHEILYAPSKRRNEYICVPDPSDGPTKKICTKSTIRRALEQEGEHQGLLRYFRKATQEEYQEQLQRMSEHIESHSKENRLAALQDKYRKKQVTRRKARERKQLERARLKNMEINLGIRSSNGKKRQKYHHDAELHDMPSLDQGDSVAQLSRPARMLKGKFKEHNRKPQGRKASHQPRKAIYHNWFSPFLFKQIEGARIAAGGPTWSTSAIVKELQKRDWDTFKALRRTTLNDWIDRSGSIPKWSERTVERIRKGNDVGHTSADQGYRIPLRVTGTGTGRVRVRV